MNSGTERWRRWTRKHLQANRDRVKKQYKKKQLWIQEMKSLSCEDCGKKFPHWVMEFDHVPERGPKLFVISLYVMHTWEQFINELFKCDLVCANCHRHRTYLRQQFEGEQNESAA